MSRKVNTNELIGAALDWAVANCEGITSGKDFAWFYDRRDSYKFSTDWAQGGPIIERERIDVYGFEGDSWGAEDNFRRRQYGPTPLIAAMRCYVGTKLGNEVEVPDELLEFA